MKEVTLLPCELACLFALLNAKSALGVHSEGLFPDKSQKDAIHKAGYEALQRHEWMTKNEETGKHSVNAELLLYAFTVAHPEFVIATEIRETPQTSPRRLMHYISRKRVIEQVYLGQAGYRLAEIDAIASALVRIQDAIGMPATSRLGSHLVTMDEADFQRLKTVTDEGNVKEALPALTKLGLSTSAAQGALVTLARPQTCGTVSIYELRGNRIEDLHVLAYFVGEGGAWVAAKQSPTDTEILLRTVDSAQLWGLVATQLGDLMRAEADSDLVAT